MLKADEANPNQGAVKNIYPAEMPNFYPAEVANPYPAEVANHYPAEVKKNYPAELTDAEYDALVVKQMRSRMISKNMQITETVGEKPPSSRKASFEHRTTYNVKVLRKWCADLENARALKIGKTSFDK